MYDTNIYVRLVTTRGVGKTIHVQDQKGFLRNPSCDNGRVLTYAQSVLIDIFSN